MPGGCATMCVKSGVILTLGSTSIVDNRVIQLLELFEQSASFSMATNPKFLSFTSRQLNSRVASIVAHHNELFTQ